jgi:hypothetical protein
VGVDWKGVKNLKSSAIKVQLGVNLLIVWREITREVEQKGENQIYLGLRSLEKLLALYWKRLIITGREKEWEGRGRRIEGGKASELIRRIEGNWMTVLGKTDWRFDFSWVLSWIFYAVGLTLRYFF